MIELTKENIRKFKDSIKGLLQEEKVTVKSHTRHSKTGKVFTVKQYDREAVAKLQAEIADLKTQWKAESDKDKRYKISQQIGIRNRKIQALKGGKGLPDRSGPRMKKGEGEDSYIKRRFAANKDASRVLGDKKKPSPWRRGVKKTGDYPVSYFQKSNAERKKIP